MAPAPHVIYSEELSGAFQRGHPMANPQPVVYETIGSNGEVIRSGPRPIEIGDVGYIQPAHGFFIRLFNVHLEPGVGGQPAIDDLPYNFTVLRKNTVTKTQDKTPVFVSHNVKTKNISASANGPFFGGFAGFSATSKRGAILATPDPIESHNAIHIGSYKKHAMENMESWHEFAVRREHDIALEDLILVTGVDLTTSWATAIFSDTELEAGFGLKVQFADVGAGIQLACQFSWQSTFGALVNSGPVPALAQLRSRENAAMTDVDSPAARPINSLNNQTLFIRHIRAKPRRPWRGLKLRAAGEKEGSDFNSDARESSDGQAGVEQTTSSTNIAVNRHPKRPEFRDCLEPVLDYILEHSDSTIAIAHDEDLVLLLQSGGGPRISTQNGIGMLNSDELEVSASSGYGTITREPIAISGREYIPVKLKGREIIEPQACTSCGRTDGSQWRKGPRGSNNLCDACGLRWAKRVRKFAESDAEDATETFDDPELLEMHSAAEDGEADTESEWEYSKDEQQKDETDETDLRATALTTDAQRELFRKLPGRSYSNINRMQFGLLSQLLKPDSANLPPNQLLQPSSSTNPLLRAASTLSETDSTPAALHQTLDDNGLPRSDSEDWNESSEEEYDLPDAALSAFSPGRRGRSPRRSAHNQASALGTSHPTRPKTTIKPVQSDPPPGFPIAPAMPTSPRTTRRNMLGEELSDDLRRNLLWQRQVNNTDLLGRGREPLGQTGVQLGQSSKAETEEERLEREGKDRRAAALERHRSWNDDYHNAGW
ncbi:unnamed protein product [Peniophora sp. CBMAI 1063]|nr:unnamed protein product [Peniophora sp. CBMAI 1063]